VGKERFTKDAAEIMQCAVNSMGSEDEELKDNSMIALERISSVIAPEVFAQWLPQIVPFLFARLTEKVTETTKELLSDDLANLLAAQLGDDDVEREDNFELVAVPDPETGETKVCVIKSSSLEDLKNAINCLHTLVSKLGSHFTPYFQQTAKEMLPLIEFPFDDDTRSIACMVWGELVTMARTHEPQIMREMVLTFVDRMVVIWNKPNNMVVNVKSVEAQTSGVVECIKNAGPGVLDRAQVEIIGKSIMSQLQESLERDNEEDIGDDDEIEAEKNLRETCSDVFGALLEHYQEDFNACLLQPYMQLLRNNLMKTDPKHEEVYKFGLYMAADIFNHVPYHGEIWSFLLPILVPNIDVSKPDAIIHNSSYSLGLAALKQEFEPYAEETAKRLAAVIDQRRIRKKLKDEKLQLAVDNSLFALGNTLTTHFNSKHSDLWKCWLRHLPCREDLDEGVKTHKLLVTLAKNQHGMLTGNETDVLRIFADVYKTQLSDDEINQSIRGLVSMAGQNFLAKYAGELSTKQQKKLLRMLNEGTTLRGS